MEDQGWCATDYAWDPYRLIAVQDASAAALHANAQQLRTQPETLVPPVLPGPALPSAAASRANKAVCKVEGCQRLLRDEKPYYQRFLVCEEHMRSLSIEVNGQLSRFCQQCGKFEPVEAFDNTKRSCRARLQEHNKRRRKMGVNSRSMRKNRRNAAALNKARQASKSPAAAAAAAEDHSDLPEEHAAEAAMDAAGAAAASADADTEGPAASDGPAAEQSSGAAAVAACTEEPAAAAFASSTGSCSAEVRQCAAAGEAARPADTGAAPQDQQVVGDATRTPAISTGCSELAQHCHQPQEQQQAPMAPAMSQQVSDAAPAAEDVVIEEAVPDADDAALLPAASPGACWSADPAECWAEGLLSIMQPGQEEEMQRLLLVEQQDQRQQQEQQQQQQLPWPARGELQPQAAPASPTISDMMADIPMADAASLQAIAAPQSPTAMLPVPAVYESSLLYLPAVVKCHHQEQQEPPTQQQPSQQQQPYQQLPAAALADSGPLAGSSSKLAPSPAASCVVQQSAPPPQQVLRGSRAAGQGQASAAAQASQPSELQLHRKYGSSCSSSSAAMHDGSTVPAQDGNTASASVGADAAAARTREAVKPSCEFTEEHCRLLEELLNESADLIGQALQPYADAPPAAAASSRSKRYRGSPQPADAQDVILPRADHAMPLPSIALPPLVHRDDSAEDNRYLSGMSHSSSDSGGSSKRAKPRSGAARRSTKHAGQEAHSMQLQQQQAQYQQLQALQAQFQQSFVSGFAAAPPALSPGMAAAGVADGNVQAFTGSCLDLQLQGMMMQAGPSEVAVQRQQHVMAGAVPRAGGSSSGMLTAQGMQGYWGVADPTGYNAMQQSLQQQQQQQQLALQQWGAYGMSSAPIAAGGYSSSYDLAGMGPGMQWGRDPALAAAQVQWQAAAGPGSQQPQMHMPTQLQTQQQQALAAAMAVAQGGGANASYQPVDSSLRMSVKIHGAEPSQLQPELLPRLNALLGSNAPNAGGNNASQAAAAAAAGGPVLQVECGYMRPGCVHLVLQLRSTADLQAAAETLAAAANGLDASSWAWALLNSNSSGGVDSQQHRQQQQGVSITVQLANRSVVLVRDGQTDSSGALLLQQLLHRSSVAAPKVPWGISAGPTQGLQLPQLQALLPCCISSCSSAVVDGRCHLLALGTGLSAAVCNAAEAAEGQLVPLARCQGMFLPAEALPATPGQAATISQLLQHARGNHHSQEMPMDAADSCVSGLVVDGLQPYGLVMIEYMKGVLLSEAQPLLVVDDDAVAAEIQGLQAAIMAGGQRQAEAQQVLLDFGRLLDFRAAAERHAASAVHGISTDGEDVPEVAHQQRPQQGRRSISAPIPQVRQQSEASSSTNLQPPAAALCRVGSLVQPQGAARSADPAVHPTGPPACHNSSSTSPCSSEHSNTCSSNIAAEGAADHAEAVGCHSGAPSRTPSSSSLRSSLRRLSFSLQCFSGKAQGRPGASSNGPSSSASSFSRRRSFGLEAGVQPAEDARASLRRGLAASSSGSGNSFSRRLSFALESFMRDPCEPELASSDDNTAGSASTAGGRAAARSASMSCLPVGCSIGSRRRSFALEAAKPGFAGAADVSRLNEGADPAPSRRRSFGDFVSRSSSRSFRALARGLACAAMPREGLDDQQQLQEEGLYACQLGAGCSSSMAGPGCSSSCGQQAAGGADCDGPQELRSMPVELEDADTDTTSEAGDSVSSFAHGHEPVPTAAVLEHPLLTLEYKGLMLDMGASLLAFFLDRGWHSSARMVVDALVNHAAPVASFSAIAAAVAECRGERLGMLHRAVRSGQLATIIEVLHWGVLYQTCLSWEAKGVRGLTPLHLLAITGSRGRGSVHASSNATSDVAAPSLAAMVLQASPGLCPSWFNVRDDAGMAPAQYALSMHGEHINQLASSCILSQDARAASPARPAAHQLRSGSPSKQAAASTAGVGGTAAAGAAGAAAAAAAAKAGRAGQAAAATGVEGEVTPPSHVEQAAAPLVKPTQGACSKHSSPRSSSPAATAVKSVPLAATEFRQPAAAPAEEVYRQVAAAAAAQASEASGTAGAAATACTADAPEVAASGAQLAAAEASRSLPADAAAATAVLQPAACVRATATADNSKQSSSATPAHVASPVVADAGNCTGASAALGAAGSPAAAALERSSSTSSQTSHAALAASSSKSCQQIQWPPAEPAGAIAEAIADELLCGLPSAAGACGSGSSCSSSFVMDEGSLRHSEQLADVGLQLPLAQLQPHAELALPQQQPSASAAVAMIAHVLTLCRCRLEASPAWHLCLRVCLMGLRLLSVLLLLKAVLHGSVALMVLSVGALTANTLLLRLLGILVQPALCASLTNASELQRQLLLLLDCAVRPLPCPHSQLLLVFESKPLEDQYRQVLAEARQQVDAMIAGSIKAAIAMLPLLVRCGRCRWVLMQLLAAPGPQWNLPTVHLLAAAAAAGLPLIAALLQPGNYHSMRDSVLAAAQVLLLAMLRKPLLAAAATGGAAVAAVSGSGMAGSAQLFPGCMAALLLLLFRQRLCWAVWQAGTDAALGLALLCWEWYHAGQMLPMHSCIWTLLHVLMPVLLLPVLYLREKVDRQMVLASVLPQKQEGKQKGV